MATMQDVDNILEELRDITGNSRLEVASVGGQTKVLLDVWTDGETGRLHQIEHARLGKTSTQIHAALLNIVQVSRVLAGIPRVSA
jgi:hypothetical protein